MKRRHCRICLLPLTENNWVWRDRVRLILRTECRICINKLKNARRWRKGITNKHPCEGCGILCIRKFAHAFCSLDCRIKAGSIKNENGCWVWQGKKNQYGYGAIMIAGRRQQIHRVSYEYFKKDKLGRLFVRHICNDRLCVNPDHLIAGTHQDNMNDLVEMNKKRTVRKPMRDAWDNKIY